MLLRDVFYFAIFVISITATATAAEKKDTTNISREKEEKKVKKREAIIVEDYSQNPYVYSHSPKVVYRKASRFRYGKPKSKYGSPKSNYGPPKVSRPQKKYKSKPIIKYGSPGKTYKRSKHRYGAPKPLYKKPSPYHGPSETYLEESYGPPEPTSWHSEQPGWFPEPTSFGEPPVTYNQIGKVPKQTYGEPPSESYGTPQENTYQYPTGQGFSSDQSQQNNYYTGSEYPFSPIASAPSHWQSNYAPEQTYYDNNYEHSQTHELYASGNEGSQPSAHMANHEAIIDDVMEQPETYNPKPTVTTYTRNSKKKPLILSRNKKTSRPQGSKLIVGGKYAEPPARYVPNFKPSSAQIYSDNFSPMNNYMDSEMAGTAGSAVSSYVNYKNSNLAFSPQNLNDVFGIVD